MPKKGYKQIEEHIKKAADSKRGCKHPNYGKHLSNDRMLLTRGDIKGKLNPNYKGGITPLNEEIRHCDKYNEWRINVFIRDNFTCNICNNSQTYLHAHHIKPFYLILKENRIETLVEALQCQELWYINNGITLCKECHNDEPKETPIGEKHKRSKLKEFQIIEIRKLYSSGEYTQTELSIKYNVSHQQISRIINKKRWRHL